MREKDTEQVQKTNVEQVDQSTSEQVQRLTKEERETACVYNEADGYWTIYTGVQSHIRRFDKLNYHTAKEKS